MTAPGFCVPTRILQGTCFGPATAELAGDGPWLLVTSSGWLQRGILERLPPALRLPRAVVADVPENPRLSYLVSAASDLPQVDRIVAVGGGSVLDSAKAIAGLVALGGNGATLLAHLRDGAALPADFAPVPIVAVPTTSGSGSEVTRWATIWGDDGAKFSLSHPALQPEAAILDAGLCLSLPRRATLAGGLDATSHAMESVWNRNHTPLVDALAESAIGILRRSLARALAEPRNLAVRGEIQSAAVLAGLAMATTQTALAHSISYPFTARFGLPHGLACSFTLGEVARYNLEASPQRLAPIARGLGVAPTRVPEALDDWFRELGLAETIGERLAADAADGLGDELLTPARAANNIRPADAAAARGIAQRSLKRLLG